MAAPSVQSQALWTYFGIADASSMNKQEAAAWRQ
jgi:hypothetical protein